MKILTVDFQDPSAPELFSKSLRETGFAVIKNHNIADKLIFDTYKDWAEFFASEEKHKHTFSPEDQSGYFPFKSENAKDSPKKDLKEFFHIFKDKHAPDMVKANSLEIRKQLLAMSEILLKWIEDNTEAEVKKLFTESLPDMVRGSEDTLFRVIHYPPIMEKEEEGAVRAAAHEDINLITLLVAASAKGLQVKAPDGSWLTVSCDPGNIIVNIGDMLQMASGGHYRSTTHQVVNPDGDELRKPRFSMPLFVHPRPDVRLSDKYTAREYLDERLRQIGLKK